MPEITLRVNGRDERAVVEGRTTLAELLRDHLKLTGTHVGCEHGVCGACTVAVDGQPVRSCLMLAMQAEGRPSRPSSHSATVKNWGSSSRRCGNATHSNVLSAHRDSS